MKKVMVLMIACIVLLAMPVIANQAQPVEMCNELAVDSSPPVIAIETYCIVLKDEQLNIGEALIDTNTLSGMQTQNTLYEIEAIAGTATTFAGIFAVNIGFQPAQTKDKVSLYIR